MICCLLWLIVGPDGASIITESGSAISLSKSTKIQTISTFFENTGAFLTQYLYGV
jgi:hypothetical protein